LGADPEGSLPLQLTAQRRKQYMFNLHFILPLYSTVAGVGTMPFLSPLPLLDNQERSAVC
jgi:hypothetical protein